MANELEELKKLHPVFEFKNKTAIPQEIALDEDSVLVPARGTVKLQSSKFINLPAIALFEFKKPSLDDLRAVGLLATVNPKAPAPTEKPVVKDPVVKTPRGEDSE